MATRIYFTLFFLAFLCMQSFAQELITVKQENGVDKEIFVLPFLYSDGSLKDMGAVKTGLPKKNADFVSQLNKMALAAANAGGNVFQITEMQDHKQSGRYKIKGEAFYTDKYEQVKLKAEEQRKGRFENGKYAILTVYRPVYNAGYNDGIAAELLINDTMKLEMKGNTKYVIKIAKDCDVKISDADKRIAQHINVQLGHDYYVRAYTNFPGLHKRLKVGDIEVRMRGYEPYFEVIDELQGALESSLVNGAIIISKKI